MYPELKAEIALQRSIDFQEVRRAFVVWDDDASLLQALNPANMLERVTIWQPSQTRHLKSRNAEEYWPATSKLTPTCIRSGNIPNEIAQSCDILLIDCSKNRLFGSQIATELVSKLPAGAIICLWKFGTNWREGSYNQIVGKTFQDPAIDCLENTFRGNDLTFFSCDNSVFVYVPSTRLTDLKRRYKGKRLFVVGNGPSLNDIDLDLIADDYAIAMNRISLIYERTRWRPSFYLYCSDNVHNPEWGAAWRESVNHSVNQDQTHSFIWERYGDVIENDKNVRWVKSISEMEVGTDGTFSANADQAISKSGTSINAAYQLAYYMGFSQIFLIGADLSWTTGGHEGPDQNHFDPNYRAKIPDGDRERRRMRLTHKVAKAFFDEAGVQVFNASAKTYLDIFPLVDFETVARDKSWSGPSKDARTESVEARRALINESWNFVTP